MTPLQNRTNLSKNFLKVSIFLQNIIATISLWGKMPDLPQQKCTNKRVMNYQLLP